MRFSLKISIAMASATLLLSACGGGDSGLSELKSEIVSDVCENVLPFWTRYAPAPDGGFYGQVSRTGLADERADRGGVLNSRILWSYSSAFNSFKDSSYLAMADRSQKYFLENFIDKDNGGVYWLVKPDGSVSNASKYTYAMTYAIYGLVEHYRASSDRQSLDTAVELYNTLEAKGKDTVNGGYIESFTPDWQRLITYENNAPKTLNAHLHVMEAYAELYDVWPDESLRKNLEDVFHLITGVMYDSERHHFLQYFDYVWESQSSDDSYGHDVETGWLLCRAADVLGEKSLKETARKIALDVTRTCLQEGLSDKGYMASGKYDGKISPFVSWWQEIEPIIACVNAWQISGDTYFSDSALKIWNFVKETMIDKEYGEWFSDCMDGEPLTRGNKVSMWRCPYHTVRLAVEINDRIDN